MNRQKVFFFGGKVYTNLSAYGNAVAEKYYPTTVVEEKLSAKHYYGEFMKVLQNKTKSSMTEPGIVAAYNFCREYYSLLIAAHMTTELLLDLFVDKRTKYNGKTLVDCLQEEAIFAHINDARRKD